MLLHHRTCSILLWAADRVLLVSSKTQPALLLITMLPWHAASFYPTENATICPELTDSKPGVKTSKKKKKKKDAQHTHIPTHTYPRPTGPARCYILDLHHTALTTICGLIFCIQGRGLKGLSHPAMTSNVPLFPSILSGTE